MLKVLLFALLAIGLGSCKDKALEVDQLYASLLGDKPLFEISNDAIPQRIRIKREGTNGLVIMVDHSDNELIFKFNEKSYTLDAIKMTFDQTDNAGLLLQFAERNPTTAPTNIVIKTRVSHNDASKGEHGLNAEILSSEMFKYLLGSKEIREKTTIATIQWVANIIKAKKPMFKNITRGPATLKYVSPPIIISEGEFNKLRELKDKLKSTYQEQFNKLVASGTGLIGASRNRKALQGSESVE